VQSRSYFLHEHNSVVVHRGWYTCLDCGKHGNSIRALGERCEKKVLRPRA